MTDNPAATYQARNGRIQETIDALAQYDPAEFDEHGFQTEVASEHDLDKNRVGYVLRNWKDLVAWRRHAQLDPMSPDAVKAAYDDEVLQRMATDGGSGVVVDVGFTLDEAFRAIKLLPSDMGASIYQQVLRQADTIPPQELDRFLE